MHGLTSNKQLQEFYEIKGNKGGTLTPDGKDPISGYGVAFLPEEQVVKISDNWFAFRLFLETLTALKETFPGTNIGFWLDTKTGIWYCEPSQVFTDKQEVLAFARKHDQIAVWDYRANKEIRLD